MKKSHIEHRVQRADRRTEERRSSAAKKTKENPLAAEIFETLKNTLEELHDAREELHQQGRQLSESAKLVKVERTRYRDLFDSAPYGFLSTSLSGVIQTANAAAGQMLSEDAAKLLGKSLSLFVPLQARNRFRSRLSQISKNNRPKSWEQVLRTHRGNDRLALLTVVRRMTSGESAILHWQLHDMTQRKRTEAMLRKSQTALKRSEEGLRLLASRLLAAQEDERKRVARELHDDLNQKLAILAMESETLEQEASSSPYIRERLGRLRIQLGELSESVHRLAYQLHPSILDDLGLAIALQSYVSDFSIREGIQVKIDAKDIPSQLPSGLSLCLYRITQECLRNIAKHSQANRASVKLQRSNRSINLSIKDSGVGFDQETVQTQKGGLGIISMQERVRLLHGKIRLKSRPSGGTQVRVSIPLPAENR